MLNFRNRSGNSGEAVSQWGTEGILAVLERGGIEDWHKLYLALKEDESGEIRENLSEAIQMTEGGYLGEVPARIFNSFLNEMST